jgi:hypothetical protein
VSGIGSVFGWLECTVHFVTPPDSGADDCDEMHRESGHRPTWRQLTLARA